jgi:cytochrome P450
MFGNGLATAQPEHHRRQRKLLTPIFQQRNLIQYADVMTSYAENACHAWQDGEVIDILRSISQITLRVIGKILFGIDVHDDINEIDSSHTIALRHINKSMEKIIEIPDIWSLLVYDEFGNAIKRLDDIIYKIIKDNRISGKGNLISILVNAQHENSTFMTDKQIRDEALTLFIGGYETMANALAWTWYLVTQHDHVYRKLREEVDRVLGGRTPTHADLDQLPYTLQVLKEAIRLYPPAYLISRQAIRPVDIAGIHFPAGTRLLVSPYTLHRRSDTFPAPEQFDPDRFSAECEGRLARYAYLPFGTGPHGCIGFQLAIMEAHLVLAVLAQRVTFELLPNQALKPELSLTLRTGPLQMRVQHRTGRT